MTINEETLKGKWLEIKGEIQKAWGKITASEIDQTKGDLKAIAGLVMQKHGEAQEAFHKKLSEIIAPFDAKKEVVVAEIKQSLQ